MITSFETSDPSIDNQDLSKRKHFLSPALKAYID
jgi:hypothetical protein